MKRGTPQHPKVAKLADALSVPLYAAVGLLELLWHFTAQYAEAGDIGKHSDGAIARALGWTGKPIRLIRALIDSGWIDENETHRLLIHHWSHHADDAVQMRLARGGRLFADGTRPSLCRLTKEEREKAIAIFTEKSGENAQSCAHTVRTENARCAPCPAPPSPAPPSPAQPSQAQPRPAGPLGGGGGESMSEGGGVGWGDALHAAAGDVADRQRIIDELSLSPGGRETLMVHRRDIPTAIVRANVERLREAYRDGKITNLEGAIVGWARQVGPFGVRRTRSA